MEVAGKVVVEGKDRQSCALASFRVYFHCSEHCPKAGFTVIVHDRSCRTGAPDCPGRGNLQGAQGA